MGLTLSINRNTLPAEAIYADSYGNSTSPKTPEEAVFASEEAEAVPMESGVYCRSDSKHLMVIRTGESLTNESFTVSQFISVALEIQQSLRKEPLYMLGKLIKGVF